MSATYRRLETVPPPEPKREDERKSSRDAGWGDECDADYEDFEGDR